MAKNRGYWKPSKAVFQKKKPTAYSDMSNDELIAEVEQDIAMLKADDGIFKSFWGVGRFFRRLKWGLKIFSLRKVLRTN